MTVSTDGAARAPMVCSALMRTKLSFLALTLMFVFLFAGCVVRTNRHGHHKRGHQKRGCPPGWVSNNNKCFKKGPPPGHVKTRDHR